MGDATSISWTDATWNPIRGCSRVSAGCVNCYAERVAHRFSGPGQPYDGLISDHGRWNGRVRMVPAHLIDPLRWQKPRRIFVNSMSDLFHENLEDETIDRVLAVMLLAPRHTFQVLTKRAERMRHYMTDPALYDRVLRAANELRAVRPELNMVAIDNPTTCPKPWIWLGVSVENQAAADERIPELLKTPAVVRFLSCEPLIGSVRFAEPWLLGRFIECPDENKGDEVDPCEGCPAIPNDGSRGGDACGAIRGPRIDWVIAGCESGPGARPCEVEWLRSLRDQCAAADVAFFLKQATRLRGSDRESGDMHRIELGRGSKEKSGGVIELPYLDGEQHAAFPEGTRGA